MFGKNSISKPIKGNGDLLLVQEMFYSIQGEGPFVGTASVFLRLGKCNLACSFCDTEFESYSQMSLGQIMDEVSLLATIDGKRVTDFVVITGGEPFLQPIEQLCDLLVSNGYRVRIETNGTLYRPVHEDVKIVCSPKNNGNGYSKIRDDVLSRAAAIKFLVSKSNPLYLEIADVGQSKYGTEVFIQPIDEYNEEKNKANIDYAVKMALEQGYRVSIQLHKYLNLR